MRAVRWYVSYALSYQDVCELLLERGLDLERSTVNRWVVEYAPQFENAFRKQYKRPVGLSWRMDETYVSVNGEWYYLYRAVDKTGQTVDFYFSKKRDRKAALAFFEKAIGSSGLPEKVTMDGSKANMAAANRVNLYLFLYGLLPLTMIIRTNKYLNNLIEQDHRSIKKIIRGTRGFKSFETADATLHGIELSWMLKKGQMHNPKNLPLHEQFYTLAA